MSHMDTPTSPPARRTASTTRTAWRAGRERPHGIGVPVFVADGDSDPMIRPRSSHLLAGLLPDARVTVHPDAAHGFLFQHHAGFARDGDAFLGKPPPVR
jgi:pimeloyl-ACP methyl ester carboxylesterase